MDGVGLICADELIGSCHRPVVISLLPTRTSLFSKYTLHSSLSNITLHPASQNFLVEIRDAWARPGMMCASVMCSGSHSMSRLQVWVNFMIFLFGSVMAIGLAARVIFTVGTPAIKKCPVAPEPEIAHLTALVTFCGSKIVFACGKSLKFFACTMCYHAYCLVALRNSKLVAEGRVVGMTVV